MGCFLQLPCFVDDLTLRVTDRERGWDGLCLDQHDHFQDQSGRKKLESHKNIDHAPVVPPTVDVTALSPCYVINPLRPGDVPYVLLVETPSCRHRSVHAKQRGPLARLPSPYCCCTYTGLHFCCIVSFRPLLSEQRVKVHGRGCGEEEEE